MVAFHELIHDLGERIGVDLAPDANNACLIVLQERYRIHLELHKQTQELLICSDVGILPPGRYREEMFRACLKANGQPFPRFGKFGFNEKKNTLVFFELIPSDILNGESLQNYLTVFADKLRLWQDAVERGDFPTTQDLPPDTSGFGIRS